MRAGVERNQDKSLDFLCILKGWLYLGKSGYVRSIPMELWRWVDLGRWGRSEWSVEDKARQESEAVASRSQCLRGTDIVSTNWLLGEWVILAWLSWTSLEGHCLSSCCFGPCLVSANVHPETLLRVVSCVHFPYSFHCAWLQRNLDNKTKGTTWFGLLITYMSICGPDDDEWLLLNIGWVLLCRTLRLQVAAPWSLLLSKGQKGRTGKSFVWGAATSG